jgi:hypothetical protein
MNILKELQNKDNRLYLTDKHLYFFALWYFQHYFTHQTPAFHLEMCKLLDKVKNTELRYLVICGFRDSAKTSFAKMDFIRNIVFNRKEMMFYCCYDENKSENALFDIALELQTNERILADFGQLYFDD